MKPIVIEVRDGKINMSMSEFKKYIEDAYQQGYSDAGKLGTYNPYWWRDLTCTNGSVTTNTLKINTDMGSITATPEVTNDAVYAMPR